MSKKSAFFLAGIIIIIILIISAGVLYYTKTQNKPALRQLNNKQSSDKQVEVITSDVDTSDWRTYRNEEFGFEFKYPSTMFVSNGNEVDPAIGVKGIPDSLRVCYKVDAEGKQICDSYGIVFLKLRKDLKVKDSLAGFRSIYSQYKDERDKYKIGNPKLLGLNRISLNNTEYYQARYFGGDSIKIEIYIPTSKGLLIYSYDIAPNNNDYQSDYHQKVAKAILSSVKLFID